MYQFHTAADRHDLAPFGHMGRRNVDDITVLVAVLHFKTIACKDRTSLYKRSIRERNGLSVPDQRTEKVQKTLHTGSDHDIIGRAVDIPPLSDIVSEHLTEIRLTLRFAVREKTVTLAQRTLDITLPQIEAKAFPVDTVGGKIILHRRKICMPGSGGHWFLVGDTCHVVTALGTGDDVAVCGKLKVGILDRGAAEFQFCGAFTQGRHTASGRNAMLHDQIFVMVVYLEIQAFFGGMEC